MFVSVFCFQAEDGIRDLVRSRGLGDVYKRQHVGDGRLVRADEERADRAVAFPQQRHQAARADKGGGDVVTVEEITGLVAAECAIAHGDQNIIRTSGYRRHRFIAPSSVAPFELLPAVAAIAAQVKAGARAMAIQNVAADNETRIGCEQSADDEFCWKGRQTSIYVRTRLAAV